MRKIYPGNVRYLLIAIILCAGCDFSDEAPDRIYKPEPDGNYKSEPAAQSEEPINLFLTPEMLKPTQQQEKDFLAPNETSSASFLNSRAKEDEVRFSGKLYLDDEEKDYLNAIDGAEINIEVKFE